MTHAGGEQYELRNFRPAKNLFTQQRKVEVDIGIAEYKRHCDLSRRVVAFSDVADARAKIPRPSLIFRPYFREKKTGKEGNSRYCCLFYFLRKF